jgi:hypothetical protein
VARSQVKLQGAVVVKMGRHSRRRRIVVVRERATG